jgi:hypothetical protein
MRKVDELPLKELPNPQRNEKAFFLVIPATITIMEALAAAGLTSLIIAYITLPDDQRRQVYQTLLNGGNIGDKIRSLAASTTTQRPRAPTDPSPEDRVADEAIAGEIIEGDGSVPVDDEELADFDDAEAIQQELGRLGGEVIEQVEITQRTNRDVVTSALSRRIEQLMRRLSQLTK